MLRYKRVDYETIEVHPLKKTEIKFSTDYRAVPIYINSKGEQVNDSTHIMRSIDQEFPGRSVFQTNPAEQIKEDEWLAWSEKLVKGLPTVIYGSISESLKSFNYITKVGKFSWFEKQTIKYSGAFVMTLVAKKIKKRENIEDPDLFLNTKINEWANGFAGRKFMGGETPSGADIAVYGITQSVAGLRAGKMFAEHKTYADWMRRMEGILN